MSYRDGGKKTDCGISKKGGRIEKNRKLGGAPKPSKISSILPYFKTPLNKPSKVNNLFILSIDILLKISFFLFCYLYISFGLSICVSSFFKSKLSPLTLLLGWMLS